jgi:hypothetical protein
MSISWYKACALPQSAKANSGSQKRSQPTLRAIGRYRILLLMRVLQLSQLIRVYPAKHAFRKSRDRDVLDQRKRICGILRNICFEA